MTEELDGLEQLAGALDSVIGERAYDIQRALAEQLPRVRQDDEEIEGEPIDDSTRNSLLTAARMAFDYKIHLEEVNGKERAVVSPQFVGPDGNEYPLPPTKVAPEIAEVWERLAERVSAPYAVARFNHLLFVAKRGNGRERAAAAAANYIKSASSLASSYDKIHDLSVAIRLAAAVREADIQSSAIALVRMEVESALAHTPPVFGPTVQGLRLLVGELGRTDDIVGLLAQAYDAFPDVNQRDRIIQLQLKIEDPHSLPALRAKRVELWLDAAAQATTLIRAGHLKTALSLAEKAGDRELTQRAAAALQSLRSEDLGMMSITASSSLSAAEAREVTAHITEAETWQTALLRYAFWGPPTGQWEQTEKAVEEQARSFIFSLLPTEMYGADNLPRFYPEDDQQKHEMALAQHETFHMQAWIPHLARALHGIADRHGMPSEDELAAHFVERPILDEASARAIGRSFARYWVGDYEGAALAAATQVEAVARLLLIKLDAGIYRLQRQSKPGQYPGLAVLLNALLKKGLNKSWYRYILTLCANPAGGWNLRNDLLHGFHYTMGPYPAAALLQCVAYLSSLTPSPSEGAGERESEDSEAEPAGTEMNQGDANSTDADPDGKVEE